MMKLVIIMKNYIRMNDSDNYLSLGNLFRVIKKLSKNTTNTVQTELFCLLFDIEAINTTTVNNYCVGSRSIGNIYKQKYLNYQKKYFRNDSIFEELFLNLIERMDGKLYKVVDKRSFINNNEMLITLVDKMFLIMKNINIINYDLVNNVSNLINNKNYYNAFSQILFYIVLENRQPLYSEDQIKETLNELICKTNISMNDIRDIMEIELCEGLSYYRSLLCLAKKNNPYALYKLAQMEYLGEVQDIKILKNV